VVFLVDSFPAFAQSAVGTGRIGDALSVTGTVESNVQGRAYPLVKGGSVYQQQFVNTRAASKTTLGLLNESKFHIGPNTSVQLDKSVYDPKKQSYHASMHMKTQNKADVASGRLTTTPNDKTHYDVHTAQGVMTVKPR